MKKILLGMLLFGVCGFAMTEKAQQPGYAEVAPADTLTLDHLVGMDKKQFKGKSLEEFLKSPEAKGRQGVTYRVNEDGSLQALKVKYSDKLFLNIYLKDFRSVKALSAEQKADLEKLKHEIIDEMRVVFVLQQ